MSKKSYMTHITPLPATISRESAVKHLHDHEEMIKLNPLVLRHARTSPPPNATKDEVQEMIWYEITDEIQYLPGTPLKGEVSYKAGFYDLALGLQTHTFAPAGVDIQGKWVVGGNAPGEPKEPVELGVDKPREGLYIREDVELKCNVLMSNFVKRNLKKSHGVLVGSLIKGAGKYETRNQQVRPDYSRASSAGTPWTERDGSKLSSPAPSDRSYPATQDWRDTHLRQAPAETGGFNSSTPGLYSEVRANKDRQAQQSSDYPQQTSPTSNRPQRSTSVDKALPAAPSQSYNGSANPPHPQNSRQQAISHSANDGAPPPSNALAMELDGNPVAAQYYYMYQGQKAAELE